MNIKKALLMLSVLVGLSSNYVIKACGTMENVLNAIPACSTLFYNPTNKMLTKEEHNVVYDLLVKNVLPRNNEVNIQEEVDKQLPAIKVIYIPATVLIELSTILTPSKQAKSLSLTFKVANLMWVMWMGKPMFEDSALEKYGTTKSKTEEELLKAHTIYCDSSNARATHLLINNIIIEKLSKGFIETPQDFIKQLHSIVNDLVDGKNIELLTHLHSTIDEYYAGLEEELSPMIVDWNNK